MTPDDHQRVINELQKLVDETQLTLTRFKETGMDEDMPEDFEKLLEILDGAIKRQRAHTNEMLG